MAQIKSEATYRVALKRINAIWISIACAVVAVLAIGAWWVYKCGFDIDKPVYIYIDGDDTVDSVSQKTEGNFKRFVEAKVRDGLMGYDDYSLAVMGT